MSFTKTTEQESKYTDLEHMSTGELLTAINNEDKTVAFAVEKAFPQITALTNNIVNRLQHGGRLFYIGAGTSGRLGILDASECPPTFGVAHELVIGLIAGGDTAIRKAVENAEDNILAAKEVISKKFINSNDVVIGLAASGNTPFTCKVLEEAGKKGALTIAISNNPDGYILKFGHAKIILDTQEEVISGSTRLKAGTAQKICLNIISSMVMIKMGRIKNGIMSHMVPTNEKLRNRKLRINKQL